ncbi:glutamate receptor [Plakobranchus ocellatus]|uniref:Glutamate receptor n=1 Tax=Plakobranchus ocellatus TaxID=259542 RepID=A0AAV3ZRP3_9GAST|nr:glutamate receptor [Plakobranchus ocellatus]
MVEPADNQWGAPLSDGSWTGIVGMLQKKEIDISVAALMITPERAEVMDATFPYYYDNVAVLYKRPDPKENLWQTYFYPFKQQVYVFILASLGGASILYAAVALLSPLGPLHSAVTHRRWFKVISCAEDHISQLSYALIHQSQKYLPSYPSGRVFLSFWWIFAIMLAATYKGNLMAFLLVAKTDRPFTTLWDLGNQNVYKWGVTGSTVVEYLFNISSRPDFQKLGIGLETFKAIDPETNSTDPEVHLRKVKQGNYAYISDQVPMETWIAVDCDLRILEERVIPLPFIVGLHNNSAYVTAFNEQLLDIDQMGLYNQWKVRWWPAGNRCSDDTMHESRAVTLLESQSAFYILCIGFCIGSLILVVEYAWTTGCCVLFRKNSSDLFWH